MGVVTTPFSSDEKDAITNANTPSSTNTFVTENDVGTYQSMMPIGIKWDTARSSPTLQHIDINGNEIITGEYYTFDDIKAMNEVVING